ncbi:hypothetical protein NLI94_14300, partial [Acidithiobacillus ferrivorans]
MSEQRPSPSINTDAGDEAARAGYVRRVRRAWRVTSQVRVLWPGIRRAEGKEKGKGVVARRGLEEA